MSMMVLLRVSELKARCLAVLDEVARTGERVILIRRGKPVAQISPALSEDDEYPQHQIQGTVEITGDVVSPVLSPGS